MDNNLADVHPELLSEWSVKNSPLTPEKITYGSNKVVWWKGKCGHEWRACVKNRVRGSGCPYCSHNMVLEGFNDLASQFPQIAAEWSERNYPLRPTEVAAFANKKVWWRCSKGHEWNTLISTRSGGSNCPYCSGIILLKGFNDLATTRPELAEEWSERNLPLTPDKLNEKSRKNVWWKCKTCGYEWKSVIHSRTKGSKCPVCADRAVLIGHNDLETTEPHLLDEWDYDKNKDIIPSQISRNSMRGVWWKCFCGHVWKAKISDRTLEGKGCKVCEREYQSVFPGLVVSFYGGKKGLKVMIGSDDVIGVPLETYMPDEKLAIEFSMESEQIELLKEHICKQRRIKLVKVIYKPTDDEAEFARKIKQVFRGVHIYITSDEEEDVAFIRKRFSDWRKNH